MTSRGCTTSVKPPGVDQGSSDGFNFLTERRKQPYKDSEIRLLRPSAPEHGKEMIPFRTSQLHPPTTASCTSTLCNQSPSFLFPSVRYSIYPFFLLRTAFRYCCVAKSVNQLVASILTTHVKCLIVERQVMSTRVQHVTHVPDCHYHGVMKHEPYKSCISLTFYFLQELIYYIHARIFRILNRFCAAQFLGFPPPPTFFL